MKILSIGNFGKGWDGSICDEEHIASALEELGHEVTRLQREECHQGWEAVGGHPGLHDIALISQYDRYTEDFGDYLKQYVDKVVYWAFDYQADGQEWHENLVRHADLYLSKRIADSKYPNWQWLSQDFAPKFLDKWEEPISIGNYENPIQIKKDIDVLFTGSYLPWANERNETIKAVNKSFNLVVHSVNDWPFLERRPPIMDEGLPELYARAKVVLSIDHTIEAGYWSDRPAQIMACGGFVLHRYQPLCRSIFKDHVGYFHDVDDCLYRLEQLLERPQEDLDSVAEAGYVYAQNYMMVGDRVRDLITIVEGIL